MTELSVGNLVTYSAQVMVVVALGAAGASLFRLPRARARLVYWRLIIVACLMLPFFPAQSVDVVFVEPVALDAAMPVAMGDVEVIAESAPSDVSWLSLLAWLLVAGAAGRAAWIAIGFISLARLRRESESASLDDEVEVLRRAVAPRADLRWHDRIAQPITFGWRRPIVLLPRRVADLSIDAQRAVVCHELLHVARRDWAWLLVEEAIQCAFWFHPGIWWALSQVQLSREETVDEQVIRITSARRPYMSALVMFAGEPTALAAAMPFIRRRHLVSRIKQLSEEHAMSSVRVACAATALAAVVVGASWAAAASLPLQARELVALPVPQTMMPAPIVLRPVNAQAQDAAAIEQQERANEQHKHAGGHQAQLALDHLAEAARKMHAAADAHRELRLQHERDQFFNQEDFARELARMHAHLAQPTSVYRVTPVYPEAAKGHAVDAVVTLRVTVGPAGEVAKVETLRTRLSTDGDINDPAFWASQPSRVFAQAAEDALRQWRFEPSDSERTFDMTLSFSAGQASPAGFVMRTPAASSAPTAGATGSATPGTVPERAPARVRVGGIRQPTQISKVAPEYPAMAKAARVQGVVILELVIATDGSVSDAKVLRSIPLLDKAAIDAVRQWKYTPTLLNGQPVELIMTVTANFTLPPEQQ